MLKLIIEDDEGRKTVVPFVREEITIGRQEGNTIRLTERNVSRRHARLVRQNGSVLVEDLGSYNGIRINGERISGQVPVADGDLIQIGDYDLAIQHDALGAPPPVPPSQEETETTTPPSVKSLGSETETQAEVPSLKASPPPPGDSGQPASPGSPSSDQSTAILSPEQVEELRPPEVTVTDLDPDEAPRLVVTNTGLAGREFACIRTELRIGRDEENEIAIDHLSLSRVHARLIRAGSGEWRLLDMESANGVTVNGSRSAQAVLQSGDLIELGQVKIRFFAPGDSTQPISEGGLRPRAFRGPGAAIAVLLLAVGAGGASYYFLLSKPRPVPAPSPARADPAPVPPPLQPPKESPADKPKPAKLAEEAAQGRSLDRAQEPLDQAKPDPAQAQRSRPTAESLYAGGSALVTAGNKQRKRVLDELHLSFEQITGFGVDDDRRKRFEQAGVEQFRKAKPLLEQCVKLYPNFAHCHLGLGSANGSLGDPEQGKHHYRLFLKLAPSDKMAPLVQKILENYEFSKTR